MSTRKDDIVLPGRVEAIDTITRFTELDPSTITDHTRLAHALGSMSAALSTVAHDYGKMHPYPGIEANVGLQTEVGNEANRHRFTVTGQDQFGLSGAHISRSAINGGTDKYHRHVRVPTETILRQFQEADPATLRQGYVSGRPSSEDIYALAVTTDQGVRIRQEYWPFHMPVSRPDDYPTTPAEDALRYTQLLQGLSTALLEVVR